MKTPNKKNLPLSNKKTPKTNNNTKKCLNCLKTISSAKKVLHERFCKLNVKRCPICDDPVPTEEFEEHLDNHKTFSSTRAKFTKSKETLFPCKYCSLQLSNDELEEHEYMCGGKTETCLLCKKLIPRKCYENHLNNQCEGIMRTAKKPITYSSGYSSSSGRKFSEKTVSQTRKKKINYSSVRKKLLSMDKEISKKEMKLTKKNNEQNHDCINKNLLEYLNFEKSASNFLRNKHCR